MNSANTKGKKPKKIPCEVTGCPHFKPIDDGKAFFCGFHKEIFPIEKEICWNHVTITEEMLQKR